MDPYKTLGISRDATELEIKKAFRKAAMNCHPDRVADTVENKERFLEISRAYKKLIDDIKESAQQEKDPGVQDDAFWDEMLEYAITLVQSGYSSQEVTYKVSQNGCGMNMAATITDQAFKFQKQSSDKIKGERVKKKTTSGVNKSKFDYKTSEALLGKPKTGRENSKKISFYQDVLNELYKKSRSGAMFSINKNPYLSKVFNRAIFLFIIIAVSVYYFPIVTRFIPLGLVDFFQLPNIVLSLVLIWAIYRRLWLLSIIGIALFGIAQIYYYHAMPESLEKDYISVLITAVVCYMPFLVFPRGANFFFFKKSMKIIESVDQVNPDPEERLILLKNRGGVSRFLAWLFVILFGLYFLHMIPQDSSLDNKIMSFLVDDTNVEIKEIRQIKNRASESHRLFETAENYFYLNPPEYDNAMVAYIKSANYGSLLSSYKLGYMFLNGMGGTQDDQKAFYYFNQAVDSSLASQPHNLTLVTKWLAESYKSLGVMYLGGYGTAANNTKAVEMFRQAVKYGNTNGAQKLIHSPSLRYSNLRVLVTPPDYNQE